MSAPPSAAITPLAEIGISPGVAALPKADFHLRQELLPPLDGIAARGGGRTNTDLPGHACTTIGREYAVAAALGCLRDNRLAFTRNAIAAAFTTAERRSALLSAIGP